MLKKPKVYRSEVPVRETHSFLSDTTLRKLRARLQRAARRHERRK